MSLRDSAKMGIDEREIRDVLKRFDKVLKEVNRPDQKLPILRRQAQKIVKAARNRAPVSKKPHYLYNTTKILANRRAKRGSGMRKAMFIPGNLKYSIRTLALRRARKVYIGPKILKKTKMGAVYGPHNPNAYYAAMVYGSAKAFRNRVMIPALMSTRQAIIKGLERSMKTQITKFARRQKLAS